MKSLVYLCLVVSACSWSSTSSASVSNGEFAILPFADSLVSQSPGPTSLAVTPGQIVNCSAFIKNMGTSPWSNQAGNSNVEVRSVDSLRTTTVVSPLANNWLSSTAITSPSLPVYAKYGAPNPANSCHLYWTASGDDGWVGRASRYQLKLGSDSVRVGSWGVPDTIAAPPRPATPGAPESLQVTGLLPDSRYFFMLKTADEVPNWSPVSNRASITTADNTYRINFTVKAPTAPGRYVLFLALYNPTGGYFSTTVKMVFTVAGSIPPSDLTGTSFVAFAGNATADGFPDWGLYQPAGGNFYIAPRDVTTNQFLPQVTPAISGGTTGEEAYQGDFNGDGLLDVALRSISTGTIRVALRKSDGTGYLAFTSWATGIAVTTNPSQYEGRVGDIDGDGKDDFLFWEHPSGSITGYRSSGNAFAKINGPTTSGALIENCASTGNLNQFEFRVGYLTGVHKICCVFWEHPTGNVFVFGSTGSALQILRGPTPSLAWIERCAPTSNPTQFWFGLGDVTGDGKDELLFWERVTGNVYVFGSTGSAYQPLNGPTPSLAWIEHIKPSSSSTAYQPVVVDPTNSSRKGLAFYELATGQVTYVASTGTSFVVMNGAAAGGSWINRFGIVTN